MMPPRPLQTDMVPVAIFALLYAGFVPNSRSQERVDDISLHDMGSAIQWKTFTFEVNVDLLARSDDPASASEKGHAAWAEGGP